MNVQVGAGLVFRIRFRIIVRVAIWESIGTGDWVNVRMVGWVRN